MYTEISTIVLKSFWLTLYKSVELFIPSVQWESYTEMRGFSMPLISIYYFYFIKLPITYEMQLHRHNLEALKATWPRIFCPFSKYFR